MEPLCRDDPVRVGPYIVVGRAHIAPTPEAGTEHRFIARTPDGDRTVFLRVALDVAQTTQGFARRFHAEAEHARSLGPIFPRLAPIEALSSADERFPWTASPYIPALSLRDALVTYRGPLPERTVRAVGAALAETVKLLHDRGVVHAGISPDSVLLTGDGPILGAFGAVRVVAEDGEDRTRTLGLAADSVAPEQLTGGRPRPLGDVYALGAVLCYAATGEATAAPDELPPGLREMISSCLAPDPADRPQAVAVLDELAQGAGPARDGASQYGVAAVAAPATVLDAKAGRAEAFLVPGWLPGSISAALSRQAADVLAAESEEQRRAAEQDERAPSHSGKAGKPAGPPSAGCSGPEGSDTNGAEPALRAPAPALWSRRRLAVLGSTAATGVVLGGIGTWAASAPDPPTAAEKLAAKPHSRKRRKGVPPNPRWSHELPGPAPRHPPLVHSGRGVVVVASETAAFGLSLRSGKLMWSHPALSSVSGPPRSLGGGLVLVPGDDTIALDVRTGKERWQSKGLRKGGETGPFSVLAVTGGTAWFYVADERAGSEKSDASVIAFSVMERKELWRRHVAAGLSEGHLTSDALLLTTPGRPALRAKKGGHKEFLALDRRTGKVRWRKKLDGVAPNQLVSTADNGRLVVADDNRLRCYPMAAGDAKKWSVRAKEAIDDVPVFGSPCLHDGTAYATDTSQSLYAVDMSSGDTKWTNHPGWGGNTYMPPADTMITPSGRQLFSLSSSEVIARDPHSGRITWRFLDQPGRRSAKAVRRAAMTDDEIVVVSKKYVYTLPLG